MAEDQRSKMNMHEGVGYIAVAAVLMVALIGIAIVSPNDADTEFELSVQNISKATLGVPQK